MESVFEKIPKRAERILVPRIKNAMGTTTMFASMDEGVTRLK